MPLDARIKPLRRVSQGIDDPKLAAQVRQLEDKIEELDQRLVDLERRATAGGI